MEQARRRAMACPAPVLASSWLDVAEPADEY
jgi:hypothetical protein